MISIVLPDQSPTNIVSTPARSPLCHGSSDGHQECNLVAENAPSSLNHWRHTSAYRARNEGYSRSDTGRGDTRSLPQPF